MPRDHQPPRFVASVAYPLPPIVWADIACVLGVLGMSLGWWFAALVAVTGAVAWRRPPRRPR